ncbi:multicopper oxidase domain-containing protein [Streptomyces sp. NPDC093111]|uniref:multicopper oxidase family protein n=1 Tax=Streptomyces sp. NPDC093111 TaxID=3154978 RepID=UPI00342BD3D1
MGATWALMAAVPGCRRARPDGETEQRDLDPVAFTRRLAIPPLAASTVEEDGTRVFDLHMQAGETEFTPGRKTTTWGFNGCYLGPTLRATRGETVRVRVTNGLDEDSTVHWHGMHVPADMDGGPHQMIRPGGSWAPHWTVEQPAATLWYHPHPHGATARHVQQGLAGMFILDDEASGLRFPHTYGRDDVPLIVRDVPFGGTGSGAGRNESGGTAFLVNGTLEPHHEVRDETVRLRLLNASASHVYSFGFADKDFILIGTDGGLLTAPTPLEILQLSPGERAEIIVRMRPGERSVLRHSSSNPSRGNRPDASSPGVLELRAAAELRPSATLPAKMALLDLPHAKDSSHERDFVLRMPGINGGSMDMARIDVSVVRGTTETWIVRNEDGMAHNFHVHDVQFRVISVNDEDPPPELRGPKDTVFVPSGASVKLVVRFQGPADPNTPYMYHCHLLPHEDSGMMGQFVVVEASSDPPSTYP